MLTHHYRISFVFYKKTFVEHALQMVPELMKQVTDAKNRAQTAEVRRQVVVRLRTASGRPMPWEGMYPISIHLSIRLNLTG